MSQPLKGGTVLETVLLELERWVSALAERELYLDCMEDKAGVKTQ